MKSNLRSQNNTKDLCIGKKMLNPQCTLRSHLDGVRDLFFPKNEDFMVSVSEDCLVKLWDTQGFQNGKHIEPYLTVRGHKGQIFTLTGNNNNNIIYTAGSDQQIISWNFPRNIESDTYGPSEGKNYMQNAWDAHSDIIWELNHHPINDLLLSSSSDGTIKIWSTQNIQQLNLATFTFRPQNLDYANDIPTSVCWLNNNNIVSGYVNSSNLVCFDSNTTKIINMYHYNQDSSISSQANKIIRHPTQNYIISAHEDKQIRFFDLKSNKMINNVRGHTDSVTSLCLHQNENYFASVGHDGSLRVWDIRKYQCLCELPVHNPKYDESIHVVAHSEKNSFLGTGGADGLIKIFQSSELSL